MLLYLKLFLTACLMLACNVVQAQYAIGSTTITFNDPARTGGFGSGGGPGRQIQTEVYYPATTAGTTAPVAPGNFPHIVFGHGFVMTWSAYQNVWEELVPNGYIVIFPRTEDGFSPSHTDFGLDLAIVAEKFGLLNTEVTSIFYQKLTGNSALMGHSMGGGAAFLAAQNNGSTQALATFAAAETTPSAVAAASLVSVPTLVMAGANDCVTPAVDHQILMYDATTSNCKTYVSITGASHCQFANYNFNCALGEATCTPAPAISRTVQHQNTFKYLVPWLEEHLKQLPPSPSVQTLLNASVSSEVTWQQDCLGASLTLNKIAHIQLQMHPNPTMDFVILESSINGSCNIQVFSVTGNLVFSGVMNGGSMRIDCAGWANGMYLVSVSSGVHALRSKLIKVEARD